MNLTDLEETPCPVCSATALKVEWRTKITVFPALLAGARPKALTRDWPWLVCTNCGVEARGEA